VRAGWAAQSDKVEIRTFKAGLDRVPPESRRSIFEANKPMLKDPDEIYPGQVLRIPPLS
jgi:nucleoid-associated protein YgaU